MRPRPETRCHPRSVERQLWQIHSGPNWKVRQSRHRWTTSSWRCAASQNSLSRPSRAARGVGNPAGRQDSRLDVWLIDLSAQNEIADRRHHRARGDQRYLGVLDLAGGRAANLAHGFDDQLESVHVTFGEVAAAGVERELAVGRRKIFEGAELVDLVGGKEAVLNETHHDSTGEIFVGLHNVNVLRPDARHLV